jgi:putative membrane protein
VREGFGTHTALPAATTAASETRALPAPPGTDWARLHPLTPVLRGWRALGLVAAITAQDGLRRGGFSSTQFLLIVAIVLPVSAFGGYLSWLRRRWRVEGGDLRLEYGIFTRKSRRVPLARLQAIDVVRPLLARALGLAELRIEVVGHGSTEANLAYLTEDEALTVRAHLLDLAHRPVGALRAAAAPAQPVPSPDPTPASAPAAPPAAPWGPQDEAVLATVPASRFVISLLLSATGAFAGLFVAAIAFATLVTPAAAGAIVAAMLPIGATLYYKFTVEFGFTVSLSPQGVRLKHGLLDTRHQTVPRGRVQAIRVVEPFLWRRLGWMRIEVDVAGYRSKGAGGAEERASIGVLIPVAPRAEAQHLIQTVLPGLRLEAIQLTKPPLRARWRAPLSWQFLAGSFDHGWSVTTYGRIRRVTDIVPQDKLQSVRLVSGPLQRRLRLATVHLDTAGRNVHAAFRHRDQQEAAELTDALAEVARSARSYNR